MLAGLACRAHRLGTQRESGSPMNEALTAETISITVHGGGRSRPIWPGRTATARPAASWWSITCPAMTQPPRRSPGTSPRTATPRRCRTSITAKRREPALTMRRRRRARRSAGRRLVADVGRRCRLSPLAPRVNGKVGLIGYRSGGRQSFLSACSLPLEAAVDCYGALSSRPSARNPAPGRPPRRAGAEPVMPAARAVRCRRPVPGAGRGRRARPRYSPTRGRSSSSTPSRALGTPSSLLTDPLTGPRPRSKVGPADLGFLGRYLGRLRQLTCAPI